jgi:ZIP family zinc transporter
MKVGCAVLLAAIACAAFLSTMTGGLCAYWLHDRLHWILGFSAGAVIGVAFFDLLPEAIDFSARSMTAHSVVSWSAVGFLCYLVLDRALKFHGPTKRGSLGASILCIHSFLDGTAIGLAFQASHAVGIVVAVAVVTHDFSDGVNTMSIVIKNRSERGPALRWLCADAAAPVLGIIATRFFALPPEAIAVSLALFAGFFLYIGASDLIPESFHAHPKFLTTAMTVVGAAVLYLAMSLAARGATVAGVDLADTAKVGSSTLVLNGAGKREKFIFDVYVAGLYLQTHESDAAQVSGDAGPKRISMTLLRNLSAEQLSDALREGIALNSTPGEIAALQPQVDALIAIMTAIGTAHKGDVITIDFLSDGNTVVGIGGEPRGKPIPGASFQRALLGVWLGAKPVQADLKEALLGH